MIKAPIAAAIMLAGATCFAVPAMAAVCATLSASPGTPAIPTWDPLNALAQEATFTVTVTRADPSTNSLRLIFLDADSQASPIRIGTTSGPRYRITNLDSGSVISYPAGTLVTTNGRPKTFFGSGPSNDVSIGMKVTLLPNSGPREDYVGGATFSETLDYAIQCFADGKDNGAEGPVSSNLTLNMTIPKLVSIVAARPKTIDFDNFTSLSQQALIHVRSTATLNVSVATSMGSQFVRNGAVAPYLDNSVIPYGMTFNGVPLMPGSPLTNQTRAGVLGSALPLELTLTEGLPSGKLAGTYTDTITLMITPGI